MLQPLPHHWMCVLWWPRSAPLCLAPSFASVTIRSPGLRLSKVIRPTCTSGNLSLPVITPAFPNRSPIFAPSLKCAIDIAYVMTIDSYHFLSRTLIFLIQKLFYLTEMFNTFTFFCFCFCFFLPCCLSSTVCSLCEYKLNQPWVRAEVKGITSSAIWLNCISLWHLPNWRNVSLALK